MIAFLTGLWLTSDFIWKTATLFLFCFCLTKKYFWLCGQKTTWCVSCKWPFKIQLTLFNGIHAFVISRTHITEISFSNVLLILLHSYLLPNGKKANYWTGSLHSWYCFTHLPSYDMRLCVHATKSYFKSEISDPFRKLRTSICLDGDIHSQRKNLDS